MARKLEQMFLCALIGSVAGLACGSDDDDPRPPGSDPSPRRDAGASPDAGFSLDGGGPVDLGAETDAGPSGLDGGAQDTGDAQPTDGGGDAGRPDAGLEIVGAWASNFGSEEIVTEARFAGTPIRAYDNAENYLVTQNATTSPFNPGLFNRIVWTEIVDDRFFYCFVDFGLLSLEEALTSTMTADPSSPESSGCGGFPWTGLRRAISLRGRYLSNFGGLETITATVWSQGGPPMSLVDWDEVDRWVVTRNAPNAEFNPSLFNRIEFTPPGGNGAFYYCFVDFALPTSQAAIGSTESADPTSPEMGGCGGFPWTRLDPR